MSDSFSMLDMTGTQPHWPEEYKEMMIQSDPDANYTNNQTNKKIQTFVTLIKPGEI
jgi:hypothetical protein